VQGSAGLGLAVWRLVYLGKALVNTTLVISLLARVLWHAPARRRAARRWPPPGGRARQPWGAGWCCLCLSG